MILGVDVSAWQRITSIPWADLKQAGVEFAIVKGDQATATANHVALARAAGMIVGTYYWQDVTMAPARQAAEFLECCKANEPDFVFLDCEMWWSDWGKWSDWIYYHKITQAQVPVMAKATIASNAHDVMQILSANLTCPVGLYSAKWFVDAYAPGIATWAVEYPFWIANYISETVHEATWAEIKAGPPAGATPVLPARMTSWIIWQYSSHKRLPGSQDTIDLNMFPGTLANFKAWAGITEPEPAGDKVIVDTGALNLRASPVDGNVLAVLQDQTPLTVLERKTINGQEWLRVQVDGWTAGWLTKPV
jgi:GH25 family lysozyme M1 (1,4-beta-N-acetylmuramidase)